MMRRSNLRRELATVNNLFVRAIEKSSTFVVSAQLYAGDGIERSRDGEMVWRKLDPSACRSGVSKGSTSETCTPYF